MKEFLFTVNVSFLAGLTTVDVKVNGDFAGVLALSQDEWAILQAILLNGQHYFMDDEVRISIVSESSIPAYLEGA